MSASLVVLIPLVLLGLLTALCFVGCGLVYDYSGYHGLSPYQTKVSTDPNIVACWLLDDGAAPVRKAVDSGPHHFDGLYLGSVALQTTAIVPNDPPSACPLFGGGFVQVGFHPELNPNGSFSIECWVQVSTPNPGGVTVVVASNNPTDPTNLNGYQLHATAEQTWAASIGLGPGPASQFLIAKPPMGSAPNVFPGVPTYLVATFDATTGTLQLFVNGLPSGQNNIQPGMPPFAPAAMPTPFSIGALSSADSTQGQQAFNGKIQDVAFYGTNLGIGTIQDHFSLGMTVQPDN